MVIDDVLIELALNVEYAATPGGPLLILDTVRVDKDSMFEVIDDPVKEENEIEGAEIVDPVRVDIDIVVVVIEAVAMDDPWMVLTVMAGATTFLRPRKLASPDAIYYSLLFCGMNHNTR